MRIPHLLWMIAFFSNLFANSEVAPLEVELVQADGYRFIAKARGNFHCTWMETRDGYAILKRDGNWYYADGLEAGQLKASERKVGAADEDFKVGLKLGLRPAIQIPVEQPPLLERQASQNSKNFDVGLSKKARTQKGLVFLVSFTDVTINYSLSQYQALFFGASGSVRDYYLKNSDSQFVFSPAEESQGTVNDGIVMVSLQQNHPNPGRDGDQLESMIRSVLSAADAQVNFSQFDVNGDHFLSEMELSMSFVLAGYENAVGGDSAPTPNLWAHRGWLNSSANYDSVAFYSYMALGERHAGSTGGFRMFTLGILCHELGHLMLGLPDLYDSDNSTPGVGRWCLMASGAWNRLPGAQSGTKPAMLSAWCRKEAGFARAEKVLEPGTQSLSPIQEGGGLLEVPMSVYGDGEYWLLEHRALTGYDAALPGEGLLIWHIDPFKESNHDETHRLVDLIHADSAQPSENSDPYGDDGDPFPGSRQVNQLDGCGNPHSRDYLGIDRGFAVRDIAKLAGTIEMHLTPPTHLAGESNDFAHMPKALTGFSGSEVVIYQTIFNHSGFAHVTGLNYFLYGNDTGTIDVYVHENFVNGQLGSQLGSATGLPVRRGWNRVFFETPIEVGKEVDSVMVVRLSTTGRARVVYTQYKNLENTWISSSLSSQKYVLEGAPILGFIFSEPHSCSEEDYDPDGMRWITHVTRPDGGFQTMVSMLNRGETSGCVRIQPYAADGEALHQEDFQLEPGEHRIQLAEDLLVGPPVSHFSIVGDAEIAITAGYRAAGGGATAHVPESNLIGQSFSILRGNPDLVFDGLALVNLGDLPAQITASVYDSQDVMIQNLVIAESLAPHAKLLFVFDQAASTAVRIQVSSDQLASALFLRGSRDNRVLFGNESIDRDPHFSTPCTPETRIIPHITRASGGFRTLLYFRNLQNASLALTLQPWAEDGTALEPLVLELAALGKLETDAATLFLPREVSHFTFPDGVPVQVTTGYQSVMEPAAVAQVPENASTGRLFLLLPGEANLVFDGAAFINRGIYPTAIWAEGLDERGEVLITQVVSEALNPNAKALVLFESLAQPNVVAVRVRADQDLSAFFLRGTRDNALLFAAGFR